MNGEELQRKAREDAKKLKISPENLSLLIKCMIEKHSQKVALFYIELLARFYKETLDKNIDNFLEMSIESEIPEVTAFLLDYKMKNNLYKESDWSL